MSTKQPKALTLAAELRTGNWAPNILQNEAALRDRAADEMERLHAENETLHVENDTLRAGYDAARLEIESLQAQAQAQQCGAGAGCCAQAARIEELEAQAYDRHAAALCSAARVMDLEAQLEAVGAGGVGPLGGAPAQPQDGVAFELWRTDHMPDAAQEEALAEWCTLHSGQPPADLLQVLDRILCDAYSAGHDGKDFDLLGAKAKVAALFKGES